MPIELTQADVDALLDIECGRLERVEAKIAGRLVMLGYLAPVDVGLMQVAHTRTQAHGRPIYLVLTMSAKRLLISVREGSDPRWIVR